MISLGGKTTPLFYIHKRSVKTLLGHKIRHAYIFLGCIAYILKRGIDASKASLLKEALNYRISPSAQSTDIQ